MEQIKADLCIIGAGAGGLSVAAFAAQVGLQVVLFEAEKMGGECLNSGCVPSKALLAVAKRHADIQHSQEMGIAASAEVDFAKVMQYVRQTVATIAPHDSVERFAALGVRVILQSAHLVDKHRVQSQDYQVVAKKILLATGSRPRIPDVPGLATVPFLTNENFFQLQSLPAHLLIMGGGPMACELGQAMALLGARVSLIVRSQLLADASVAARDCIRQDLQASGVQIYEHCQLDSVARHEGKQVSVQFQCARHHMSLKGSHLLLAAGRVANTQGLGLENVGIKVGKNGIEVDRRLRTAVRNIFALGDVVGLARLTHAASFQAGIVIKNALYRWPAKWGRVAIPQVTYTRLEVASVGLSEQRAQAQGIRYQLQRFDFTNNDRAVAEGKTQGFIEVLVDKKSRARGVCIVGEGAGELLLPWIMAVNQRWPLAKFTALIVPYPTLSEVSRRLASNHYWPRLQTARMQRLLRFLF